MPILLRNGKANFCYWVEVAPDFFFLLAAQELLKTKVSVEPCLVSVVVLMRGRSGTDEYEAVKETITVYSLQQTRLHHWIYPKPIISHV